MLRSRSSVVLAGLVGLVGATHALGQTTCRPALAIKEVRFSEIHRSQRIWTARIAVDASRCASASGRFEINFARLKENGPDLPFAEEFTWRAGEVEVTLDFWADESVLDYAIGDVAPCTCRQ
jgi:hypothetical protein